MRMFRLLSARRFRWRRPVSGATEIISAPPAITPPPWKHRLAPNHPFDLAARNRKAEVIFGFAFQAGRLIEPERFLRIQHFRFECRPLVFLHSDDALPVSWSFPGTIVPVPVPDGMTNSPEAVPKLLVVTVLDSTTWLFISLREMVKVLAGAVSRNGFHRAAFVGYRLPEQLLHRPVNAAIREKQRR